MYRSMEYDHFFLATVHESWHLWEALGILAFFGSAHLGGSLRFLGTKCLDIFGGFTGNCADTYNLIRNHNHQPLRRYGAKRFYSCCWSSRIQVKRPACEEKHTFVLSNNARLQIHLERGLTRLYLFVSSIFWEQLNKQPHLTSLETVVGYVIPSTNALNSLLRVIFRLHPCSSENNPPVGRQVHLFYWEMSSHRFSSKNGIKYFIISRTSTLRSYP